MSRSHHQLASHRAAQARYVLRRKLRLEGPPPLPPFPGPAKPYVGTLRVRRLPGGWGMVPPARRKRCQPWVIVRHILAIPHLAAGIQASDVMTHFGCCRTTACAAVRLARWSVGLSTHLCE